MKLLADVSHNERDSYGRVFSSALLEQLMGWENPNPPSVTPTSYGQNQQHYFYGSTQPNSILIQ